QERFDSRVSAPSSGAHLVPHALRSILVGAEAEKARAVAEAITLELVVAHLADELGADGVPVELFPTRPAALAAGGAAVAEVARLHELGQPALQLRANSGREPGRVPDEVELARLVVE